MLRIAVGFGVGLVVAMKQVTMTVRCSSESILAIFVLVKSEAVVMKRISLFNVTGNYRRTGEIRS
jgi:hypothetical protein